MLILDHFIVEDPSLKKINDLIQEFEIRIDIFKDVGRKGRYYKLSDMGFTYYYGIVIYNKCGDYLNEYTRTLQKFINKYPPMFEEFLGKIHFYAFLGNLKDISAKMTPALQ